MAVPHCLGDTYTCNSCHYIWQSKKEVGSPAFCPKCDGDRIENKNYNMRVLQEIDEKKQIEERQRKRKELLKLKAIQKKKGLVLHRGKWVTVAASKKMRADELEKEYRKYTKNQDELCFANAIKYSLICATVYPVIGLFFGLITNTIHVIFTWPAFFTITIIAFIVGYYKAGIVQTE